MARPSKLTPERGERIEKAVRAGNYLDSAARSAGVHPSTLYRWLERGDQEEEGIYHGLAQEVRRAEAEAEVYAVAVVRKAMADDWRAALAYLERRHPAGWRRRETRELTGPGGGAIRAEHALDLGKLSDEELELLEHSVSALPAKVEIDAERARRSLRLFVRAAWPVLEPGMPFLANWHIDAICDALLAVARGEAAPRQPPAATREVPGVLGDVPGLGLGERSDA